jgi:hypothetical protein
MKTLNSTPFVTLLLMAICGLHAAEPGPKQTPPRKAAIFVDNRAGKELNPKVIVLADFISSRVATLGFQVINREIAINALKTYSADQPKLTKQEGAGADAIALPMPQLRPRRWNGRLQEVSRFRSQRWS